MKALKTYLPDGFLGSPRIAGRVHSVFKRAVNAVVGGRMITLHADLRAGIPDSAVLRNGDFDVLEVIDADAPAWLEGFALKIADFLIDLNAPNFSNDMGRCKMAADKAAILAKFESLGFDYAMPEVVESRLRCVIDGLKDGGVEAARKPLETAVGFGCGLTPSADDALLGICAVVDFCNRAAFPKFDGFAQALFSAAQGRTTDVSAKYIRCAAEGRFPENLARLVKSLLGCDAAADVEAFERLLAVGHTSGKDIVRGVRLGLGLIV